MGVYVKGLKMPKSCSDCLFFVDGLYDANDEPCSACLAKEDNSPWGCGYKEIDGIDHMISRMYYCPLVEVPEPHGRLIDENELIQLTDNIVHKAMIFGGQICYSRSDIDNTPTVIEAEGER